MSYIPLPSGWRTTNVMLVPRVVSSRSVYCRNRTGDASFQVLNVTTEPPEAPLLVKKNAKQIFVTCFWRIRQSSLISVYKIKSNFIFSLRTARTIEAYTQGHTRCIESRYTMIHKSMKLKYSISDVQSVKQRFGSELNEHLMIMITMD